MASFADGIGQGIEGVFWLAGCAVAFGGVTALVVIGLVIYIAAR